MKSINKVESIRKKIKNLQSQINTIQLLCPHENVIKKYGANVGNYDPSEDSYWIDCRCEDCDKIWREDQ